MAGVILVITLGTVHGTILGIIVAGTALGITALHIIGAGADHGTIAVGAGAATMAAATMVAGMAVDITTIMVTIIAAITAIQDAQDITDRAIHHQDVMQIAAGRQ